MQARYQADCVLLLECGNKSWVQSGSAGDECDYHRIAGCIMLAPLEILEPAREQWLLSEGHFSVNGPLLETWGIGEGFPTQR